MNKLRALGLAGVITCIVPVANAAAVTYSFTGTVTAAYLSYADGTSVNAPVNGTFTVDTGFIEAADSTGTLFSNAAPWEGISKGGAFYAQPLPAGLVFSTAFTSGSASFTSPLIGVNSLVYTQVAGALRNGSLLPNSYEAQHLTRTQSGANTYNVEFRFIGGTGAAAPFDDQGQLVWSNVTQGLALVQVLNGSSLAGELDFKIDSVSSPVPLPAAAWLLLSGLGGLAAFAGRRRIAAA